ncbi:hypothetical protein T484DRAFT_2458805 [Baffinella frigidus]|nr:hypothetical protein T484DRAFT_2458805 [Cryptophyta sp. CCMP2293]
MAAPSPGGAPKTIFAPSQRKRQDDERFNLSPQQYLERYHIQTYLADAVLMVMDSRDERPLEATLKYFNSVLQGSHVVLREFEYVNATPRNRMSFVRIFVEDNRGVVAESEITVDDHLQLVMLLCNDFPPSIHQEAASLMAANGESGFLFGRVSAYFQVLFVFAEFMAAVRRVLTGTSAEGGRMDRSNFLWAVRNIINTKHWQFSCPAASLLDSIIAAGLDSGGEKKDTIGIAQFAAGMAQCESIVLSPKPDAAVGGGKA